ncbi:MAG TPA: poly-gamma-glutamate synthase PgsB [Candidatus Limnocylindria bacterium]|nr:poly-gamma-glutamate synthase PgsB [Candidatus Limnocylindria bacterium]
MTPWLWLAGILPAAALVWEALRHRANVRAVPVRILVNGTRGKTSVTRLLAAALRHGGLSVRAKCTGTDAVEILPDGSEALTPRPAGARITELRGFMRRAARQGARAVVVECMAVQPEMQDALARLLLRPTITIITNARVDHVEDAGETVGETAASLSSSVIPGTMLVTDEARFNGWPNLTRGDEGPLPEGWLRAFPFPVFEENVRLALAAAALCGIPREAALEGMLRAAPDTGMAGPFRVGNALVVNAFAANDPQSTAMHVAAYREEMEAYGSVLVLYNHRRDRAYRLDLFLGLLREWAALRPTLAVVGDDAPAAARRLARRLPYPCRAMDAREPLTPAFYETRRAILCVGNIKGDGHAMVRYLMDGEGKA